jgi:hypothetical protein
MQRNLKYMLQTREYDSTHRMGCWTRSVLQEGLIDINLLGQWASKMGKRVVQWIERLGGLLKGDSQNVGWFNI